MNTRYNSILINRRTLKKSKISSLSCICRIVRSADPLTSYIETEPSYVVETVGNVDELFTRK